MPNPLESLQIEQDVSRAWERCRSRILLRRRCVRRRERDDLFPHVAGGGDIATRLKNAGDYFTTELVGGAPTHRARWRRQVAGLL